MLTPKTDEEYACIYEQATCDNKLLVVKFSADWCGPCKTIAPAVKELANRMSDIVFVDYNVDVLLDHPHGLDVRGLPTFKLFRGGKRVAAFTGASIDALKKKIAANN